MRGGGNDMRVVIVGAGMAAARLADGLTDHEVTLLGDEPHRPYNRILLSAVLEGTHAVGSLTLPMGDVDLRLDTRVVEIHRADNEVELADGSRVEYDALVLATGSVPTLPPIRGIVRVDGRLDDRVHTFRSLADCLRLDESARTARHVVVVGGGLLGLQVARALGVRGLAVEVVEGGDHLLRSQVGAEAGAILARDLERLGTAVYTGARATRLTGDGLVLDNGFTLDTDLVALTAGGRPSTALARRAGLEVRRGVVVDDLLRSSDPAIHAIGDCAQRGSQVNGFVPPAWEQATLLARHLNGEQIAYDGSRSVTRLRATGLDVAVLGDPERTAGEVVEVTNPIAGSHRKLVVRDGVIVAGTLVGDLSRIGLITQYYDRGSVLASSEPGSLLMGEPEAAAHCPARRGRDLRVRRRQCRPDPSLRLARRGPRHHPRHHRLRRLRHSRPRARHGRSTSMSPHLRKKLVVVGHGMVGHRFVQAAIERGLTETYDVVVVGEEARPAYDRVALTSYFEVGPEELSLLPEGEYDDPRVRLRLDTEVTGIDRDGRTVTADGATLPYDALVLATGAAPFVPPVPGRDLPGCFVYRTIEDLEAIRAAAAGARVGAVIGGGLLGLEAANALVQLGLETHVVEMAPRLMPVQVDDAGGAMLGRHIEQLGLTVHAGAATEAVIGNSHVTGLTLKDAGEVPADLVVFSAGIRPRDGLARDAGLDLAERGGVLVDERCRTSDPHIWAVGECAAPAGRMYGLVAPGYAMAEVVVDTLLGGPGEFTGADMSTKLKLLGVDVASFGDAFATTDGALELVLADAVAGHYKKLVVSPDGKRLLGGILVGDVTAYGVLRPMVASGIELPENPEELLLPPRTGARAVGVAGRGGDLLLQQRQQGRGGRGRRGGDDAPRPGRPAGPANRP